MRVKPVASLDVDNLSVTSSANNIFEIEAPNMRCGVVPVISVYNDPVSFFNVC